MKKLNRKMIVRTALYILAGGIVLLAIPMLVVYAYTQPRLYAVQDAPHTRVAIVFGAGLSRDGTPSPILRERVATAVDLYKSGKVEKLLMSGDNRFANYNEPGAMQSYAVQLGVPEQDIVLDYAGRRTYDTCYRAKHIFDLDQALLVTQRYHQPRAVFTCNMLGLQAYGVPTNKGLYIHTHWKIREIPATLVALLDVWVAHPLPVLGKQEPIFPAGSSIERPNL